MRKSFLIIMGAILLPGLVSAQQAWTLRQCIDYALENNISVQQMQLKSDNQEIALNTARNSRLPSLSASVSESAGFGRSRQISEDGTTDIYQNKTTYSTSWGVSTGVTLYAGGRINHEIKSKEYDFQASLLDMESAREDVALNVTALYLRVLLNKELVQTSQKQVTLSKDRLRRSEELVASGKSPQSDIFESKSVLANDELALLRSQNTLKQSLLDLTQALNLESVSGGFDVAVPELNAPKMQKIEQTDLLYNYSVENRPNILSAKLALKSSEKSLDIAKTGLYPSLSLSAGYGSAYYSTMNKLSFFDQAKNNGSENIGLSLSVPIFNKNATRNNIKSAKIGIKMQELAITQAENNLRNSIEQAHSNATASKEQYESAIKSLEAAREAFRYEEEKSQVGRSTIFDYNDAKTRMERAESEMVKSKYEFIFYSKILDFYAGIPLDI